EYNDVLLTTYLSSMTKQLSVANELLDKQLFLTAGNGSGGGGGGSGWWALLAVIIAASVLLTIYQNAIVLFLAPYRSWTASTWWTPIAAIAVMVFFCIPPLVGRVIVVIIRGLFWGFWKGVLITLVGVILGEFLVFLAVRHFFLSWGEAQEEKHNVYASTATLLRSGGLWINTVVRLSFISGHVVTIVQAITNVRSWIFLVSIIPAMPRQVATVYIGSVFLSTDTSTATRSKIISYVLYGITFLFSVIAGLIVVRRVNKVYKGDEGQRKSLNAAERGGSDVEVFGEGSEEASEESDSTMVPIPKPKQRGSWSVYDVSSSEGSDQEGTPRAGMPRGRGRP
ncbi:SNARE associated Golgi protein, partial [Pseudohyphozyma bogoriensis]